MIINHYIFFCIFEISAHELIILMTIVPKQKLTINKKIDFSHDSEDVKDSGPQIAEYEMGEDETGIDDYALLEDEYQLEPTTIIHEGYSNNNNSTNSNNNTYYEHASTSNPLNANVFNQKKTQEKDYQEMLIVRQSLDFDERAFRDSYIRTESEIILKMRKDIDALYDWLDRLVAELTKSLNTFQETEKSTIEEKLRAIRENSVRADSINRSIQNFLTSIQHAYQHTFAAFFDNE